MEEDYNEYNGVKEYTIYNGIHYINIFWLNIFNGSFFSL